MKVSVLSFIRYRILGKLGALPRNIKWGLQRLFRGYSDKYLWGFYYMFVKDIYPKFKAFKDMEKHGLASCYFDDPNKIDHTDEDFEKAFENFNAILDKILFAFEYTIYDDGCRNKKFRKYFEEKYGNPYEEIEENRKEPLTYFVEDEKTGERREETLFDGKPIYYNNKMLEEFCKRQQEGFKLFGKHLLSFWD